MFCFHCCGRSWDGIQCRFRDWAGLGIPELAEATLFIAATRSAEGGSLVRKTVAKKLCVGAWSNMCSFKCVHFASCSQDFFFFFSKVSVGLTQDNNYKSLVQ